MHNACDPATTAWAFAVGTYLDFEPHKVIRDQDYDRMGDGIRVALCLGIHGGISDLSAVGCCGLPGNAEFQFRYPRLAFWTLETNVHPETFPNLSVGTAPDSSI